MHLASAIPYMLLALQLQSGPAHDRAREPSATLGPVAAAQDCTCADSRINEDVEPANVHVNVFAAQVCDVMKNTLLHVIASI